MTRVVLTPLLSNCEPISEERCGPISARALRVLNAEFGRKLKQFVSFLLFLSGKGKLTIFGCDYSQANEGSLSTACGISYIGTVIVKFDENFEYESYPSLGLFGNKIGTLIE